jgi:hypothetical protein
MENEDKTVEGDDTENDTTVEGENSSENDSDQDTTTLTVEERLAKAEAEAAKFRRLFEKSQKKPVVVTQTTETQTPAAVDVEETVLKAQGMAPELLAQLKDVAALKKVSLIEAQKQPLFVAAKEEFEKAEKSKAASVGSSRGSGSKQVVKTLNTPGLSKEDHKALWRSRV